VQGRLQAVGPQSDFHGRTHRPAVHSQRTICAQVRGALEERAHADSRVVSPAAPSNLDYYVMRTDGHVGGCACE
jgi:hypothetical protein